MSSSPRYLTGDKQAIKEFIDRFDVFLFDCDGVLWSGDHTFPGTVETIEMLRSKGKRTIFVTNNSTKSRKDYLSKLASLSIPASESEIFSSSFSAALYISRILVLPSPTRRKVFILGESGIEAELSSLSIPYICGTDPQFRRDMSPEDFKRIAAADPELIDPEVGVVLCGLDYHTNYLKLALAFHYIRYHGAVYLATNIDSTLPSARSLFPGAGSTNAAALTRMLGGQEPLAFGKPSQAMMDAIMQGEGLRDLARTRICMVGDRVDTDIRFGIDGKLGGTLGVLTGVSTKDEMLTGDVRPEVYMDKLGDMLEGA